MYTQNAIQAISLDFQPLINFITDKKICFCFELEFIFTRRYFVKINAALNKYISQKRKKIIRNGSYQKTGDSIASIMPEEKRK